MAGRLSLAIAKRAPLTLSVLLIALFIGAPGSRASHANDATLRATLNGVYRNGSVFVAGATVVYSPLFSDKLMNLSLPLTNQALRGQTVYVTPAIRAEALAEIRKATAVRRL